MEMTLLTLLTRQTRETETLKPETLQTQQKPQTIPMYLTPNCSEFTKMVETLRQREEEEKECKETHKHTPPPSAPSTEGPEVPKKKPQSKTNQNKNPPELEGMKNIPQTVVMYQHIVVNY